MIARGRVVGLLVIVGISALAVTVLRSQGVARTATAMHSPRVGAKPAAPVWVGCSGRPRGSRELEASHIGCSTAVRAIKRGNFALTPGGPMFSTPGFDCTSPILEPGWPRFTVCHRRGHSFRFYSFAEPR